MSNDGCQSSEARSTRKKDKKMSQSRHQSIVTPFHAAEVGSQGEKYRKQGGMIQTKGYKFRRKIKQFGCKSTQRAKNSRNYNKGDR